jgi:hypothetical protein
VKRPLLTRLAASVLALTALASAACGDAPDTAPMAASWTLASQPSLRIGTLDDGPDALVPVGALAVTPDGRIAVAQGQDGQVRIYAPDGTLEARIGRSGEGPGELQTVSQLGLLGDTLWITDGRLRRTSYFSQAGDLLGDERFPEIGGLGEDLRVSYQRPLAGGLALTTTGPAFRSELDGTDRPFPMLVTARDGSGARELGTRNLQHERAIFVAESAGTITSIAIFTQRWSDHTLWAAAPDGRSIVLVDRPLAPVADTGSYRVTRLGVGGDTLYSTAVRYQPTPLATAERDSLVRRYASGERSEAEVRSALFLPERHPPATAVVVALDGTTWVARERPENAEDATWDVIGPDGEHLARVTGPPGLRLLAADGLTVWGVETGAFDEPYVVRYEVRAKQY